MKTIISVLLIWIVASLTFLNPNFRALPTDFEKADQSTRMTTVYIAIGIYCCVCLFVACLFIIRFGLRYLGLARIREIQEKRERRRNLKRL
jgi:Na+/proline symporter